MKRRPIILTVLLAALAVGAAISPPPLLGDYSWRPPRPPRRSAHSGAYRHGKDIFISARRPSMRKRGREDIVEKALESVRDAVFERRLRLMELQGQLPPEEAKTVRLGDLSAKINNAQLSDLRYFVENRNAGDPPADLDLDRYQRGERIFAGDVQVAFGSAEYLRDQLELLGRYQERLPRSTRRRYELQQLAGKLDPGDFDALVQFLRTRFGIRTVRNRTPNERPRAER